MKYDLKDIIYKIDLEDMREFLYVSLIHDEDLLNRFRVEFSSYFPKLSKDDYEDKIITAIYSCMDKHGYIDYESADSYEIAMLEYVSEAEKMVLSGDYDTAFIIASVILDSIPNTNIDDSNGSTGMVADECIQVIKNVLDHLKSEDLLLKGILDYVLEEVQSLDLYNYGIHLYEMLEYFIQKQLYLEEIKKAIQVSLKSNEDKSSYIKRKYIKYLEQMDILNK